MQSALHADAASALVPPEHVLNSAVDTYNLRIENSINRRHALARGGPRGQPLTTATLEADEDAKLLLSDPSSGPSLANHNLLRGMMKNSSLIMHSEDFRHMPLAELNRGIEAWLRTAVDTNMYFTPYKTAVSAFGLHQDNMDVIIVQIAGKKTWSVYPTIFRSPDSGHTLPELFQAPLNQQRVLDHVKGLHRSRSEAAIRALHERQVHTSGGDLAEAAASFLGGSVSSTFAEGSKPFAFNTGWDNATTTNNGADAGRWVKLPINITMSPGDVLYIPHGTPHAAMPVPNDTPAGINDRLWETKMEKVMHLRSNSTERDIDHSSSLTHHLTVGLLYMNQRLMHLLEMSLDVAVRRRLLTKDTQEAILMAVKYLREEEEDVKVVGSANLDTLNVYGNVTGSPTQVQQDTMRSFLGQVLQDDMSQATYTQDALPALLRSVLFTNVLAPRSMFPAFHPCHPYRTFFFAPNSAEPLSVKVEMACSVVAYGADSTPETWREWSKSEIRAAATEVEDLVAANKRKAHHRWTHLAVALHDLLADSGGVAAAGILAQLFGINSLVHHAKKKKPGSTSADGRLARASCGDSSVFDSTELGVYSAASWLVPRSSSQMAEQSNYGRLVTPSHLDDANAKLDEIQKHPQSFSQAERRHARISARTPDFWEQQFGQPSFVMDAASINAGAGTSPLHGDNDPSVVEDIAAENAGLSRVAAQLSIDRMSHKSTLFRRRSDVPAMMVGSMPESRNMRFDETLLNTFYTRFFPSKSPMLHRAGLTTDHLFGAVDNPHLVRRNGSIARAATVSTSTNLCVGTAKPLPVIDNNFDPNDQIAEDGMIPMLLVYNADALRFKTPEIAAVAQAMVSYPPGVPFTAMDACVEGLVQLRRQDHMFFAVQPGSPEARTSPAALLADWKICNSMNTTISRLALILTKLDALVLDSGAAPKVFATFSLSEHVPQSLEPHSTANSPTAVASRTKLRRKRAAAITEALNIEFVEQDNSSENLFLNETDPAPEAGAGHSRVAADGSTTTHSSSSEDEADPVTVASIGAVQQMLEHYGIL